MEGGWKVEVLVREEEEGGREKEGIAQKVRREIYSKRPTINLFS